MQVNSNRPAGPWIDAAYTMVSTKFVPLLPGCWPRRTGHSANHQREVHQRGAEVLIHMRHRADGAGIERERWPRLRQRTQPPVCRPDIVEISLSMS